MILGLFRNFHPKIIGSQDHYFNPFWNLFLGPKIDTFIDYENLGIELISSPSQQINLANLNLLAAKKAKASAAYEPACEYLKIGLSLLPKTIWQSNYELALSLHLEMAEVAYLSTKFEQMKLVAAVIMKQARSLNDKIKIYEILIQAAEAQNEFETAIKMGASQFCNEY